MKQNKYKNVFLAVSMFILVPSASADEVTVNPTIVDNQKTVNTKVCIETEVASCNGAGEPLYTAIPGNNASYPDLPGIDTSREVFLGGLTPDKQMAHMESLAGELGIEILYNIGGNTFVGISELGNWHAYFR